MWHFDCYCVESTDQVLGELTSSYCYCLLVHNMGYFSGFFFFLDLWFLPWAFCHFQHTDLAHIFFRLIPKNFIQVGGVVNVTKYFYFQFFHYRYFEIWLKKKPLCPSYTHILLLGTFYIDSLGFLTHTIMIFLWIEKGLFLSNLFVHFPPFIFPYCTG